MAFRDLLLPVGIDIKWRSASRFQTARVRTDNGKEKRNPNWDSSLARGDLEYTVRNKAHWTEVDEMFQICQGMAHTFKVRDPRKNVATPGEGLFVAGQAVLRITRGAYTIDKPITKLDATTTITGGTVNILTGISPDGATAWSGKFYLCCVFGTDELDIEGLDRELSTRDPIAGAPSVPIEEVLGE